jgi:hypothetical protein
MPAAAGASAPAPPMPAGNFSTTTTGKPPSLELRDDEMAVIVQWTEPYQTAKNKQERKSLLSDKILPLLRKENTMLTDSEWKLRKSVRMLSVTRCAVIHLYFQQQIKVWFQNNKRVEGIRSRISTTRKPSLNQVAMQVYKKEIAAVAATMSDGAKPGSTAYLPVFQGAVKAFMDTLTDAELVELEKKKEAWTIKGPPEEMRRKAAESKGLTVLRTWAETQFRDMGMRFIIWEHHKNKAGDNLVQM